MTTNDDILKAMAAEKHKIMASAIKPQLTPNITDAEIVKAHRDATKPGRGGKRSVVIAGWEHPRLPPIYRCLPK